jgi:hypothetical protein
MYWEEEDALFGSREIVLWSDERMVMRVLEGRNIINQGC